LQVIYEAKAYQYLLCRTIFYVFGAEVITRFLSLALKLQLLCAAGLRLRQLSPVLLSAARLRAAPSASPLPCDL